MTSKPSHVNLDDTHIEDNHDRETGNRKNGQVLGEENVDRALERRVIRKCDLMILPILATIYFLAQLVCISPPPSYCQPGVA